MEEIQGIIDEIIFKNQDNGYIVSKLKMEKDSVTIVGNIPYLVEGQNVKLKGQWGVHQKFGRQFSVKECEEILPSTIKGIEKYLSSGVILGIGPITAKKIVERFGEDTLEVLDNDINKLREIEGIGEKKLDVICESYGKQKDIKNIMIFLQSYGITTNQCIKIHKRFGSTSINVVKENPYSLCEEITGIGFKTADKIARSLGIEVDSPFRIQSGVKYVVNEFSALGNTYMPKDKLLDEAAKVLVVTKDIIEKNLFDCAIENKIKIENIDGEESIFTPYYYYCELNVTKQIVAFCTNQYNDLKINIDMEIDDFERANGIRFAVSQRDAIKGAIENGVEIITGGPGTGKTTIINCILGIFERIGLKVLMGAPTGRAAKRMSESTGREARTIHRLLEMGVSEEDDDVFSKDEDSPLQCDVIIIDEASMIDISLMSNLLKAVSQGTRIIIVGDVDQLPSVGPGNVLRDLIECESIKVVRLKEIFRQAEESMIVVNAHKINNGEMPILNKKDKDFYFMQDERGDTVLNTIIELINTRLPKFNKDWNKLKHIQILSPMKKGVLGVENLNVRLQEVLNPKSKHKKEREYRDNIFRVGDKVMQTKNNYSLKWKRIRGEGEKEGDGVFNGDMGFIEDISLEDRTVTVIFDEERKVVYDNIYLDELDLAYAITIHKSQGSEFPVVVMPIFMGPPLLMNRNLLYTGVTRAKAMVVLAGSVKALKFMTDNDRNFDRYSALQWRVKDILNNDIFNL